MNVNSFSFCLLGENHVENLFIKEIGEKKKKKMMKIWKSSSVVDVMIIALARFEESMGDAISRNLRMWKLNFQKKKNKTPEPESTRWGKSVNIKYFTNMAPVDAARTVSISIFFPSHVLSISRSCVPKTQLIPTWNVY